MENQVQAKLLRYLICFCDYLRYLLPLLVGQALAAVLWDSAGDPVTRVGLCVRKNQEGRAQGGEQTANNADLIDHNFG
jgi:hypothetical protein